jgi:membrane AbrB-like protein
MLIATIIATFVGYSYLTRLRGYDPALALFCSIPGGQAEVIVLSREFVEKDYVVALCHLVRVVFVFCSVPLVLALVTGEGAVGSSNAILSGLPSVFELSFVVIGQFVGLAVAGYLIARIIRAPVPFLIGPLLLSMGFHLTGVISIPRINEFVILAQVTIGGTVGARLGQVKAKVLAGYLRDAIVNVVLVISVFVAAAFLMASIIGMEYLDVMLAFVPGGLYEVTLLSLIFGFDVAFVAIHHGVRMLFILFTLPLVLKFLRTPR